MPAPWATNARHRRNDSLILLAELSIGGMNTKLKELIKACMIMLVEDDDDDDNEAQTWRNNTPFAKCSYNTINDTSFCFWFASMILVLCI